MPIWIALYVGYAAIILCAIEELRIDKRLSNLEKELAGSKGELRELRNSSKNKS